jgi:hypothetical protein
MGDSVGPVDGLFDGVGEAAGEGDALGAGDCAASEPGDAPTLQALKPKIATTRPAALTILES